MPCNHVLSSISHTTAPPHTPDLDLLGDLLDLGSSGSSQRPLDVVCDEWQGIVMSAVIQDKS